VVEEYTSQDVDAVGESEDDDSVFGFVNEISVGMKVTVGLYVDGGIDDEGFNDGTDVG